MESTLYSVSTNVFVHGRYLKCTILAGEVIQGFDIVKKVEGVGSSGGKTRAPVVITASGTV